ncbi:aminopeptidase N [Candidatus Falkowbacteria bacterium RIFOXYB2_FULL_47_14]|uniref:Aminopeptidase N n=1 Tax=Candidatus Falkowbacteria bacterium RIFOXYA2_FULL_47_19 TaxID=1797994 RepID=A0A1F5SIH9_9BACT|nr:MAG: aminopeptidase N [Candidatus Falkowbacteria bacterium RIFOXYA2_FULL_47_19]OGF34656.1 MAG: aminopeptidase N [Candidatus Falkowbacteria bacterium RIFOXYC2_FULL_46_15]OGF42490.1 MAG: aminopeptidase N [Candidatus Falkowbacteria bacterium RIFOXYB2_FULL_47_14]
MNENKPEKTRLADYRPYPFEITETRLTISINDDHAVVTGRFLFTAKTGKSGSPVLLDGKNMELLTLKIDGRKIPPSGFLVSRDHLVILDIPKKKTFVLETEVRIDPFANESCEGLYKSGNILCTQCESDCFRRITYFPDRPDVLSVYTVRLEADREKYPVLLSNGNEIETGQLPAGRHYAIWSDPFPKPCYLFAAVAGNLGVIKGKYAAKNGRLIELRIYVDSGSENRTKYALECLKDSLSWFENKYGLPYLLDLYMIVAADSFNAGAMENTGLNIFSSRYILADPATATDSDYQNIAAIINHESDHYWFGNLVTVRDWFQLTLKEGLAVFTDQTYMAETASAPIKRIDDVNRLRNYQFTEDAGPGAAPIKPSEAISFDNLYTATTYRKGAEVVRMIHTLVGEEDYLRGIKIYVINHRGQAATTEDFVTAMETASGRDLSRFRETWYHQAGTPVCRVRTEYDKKRKTYSLTVEQNCPPTPECSDKKPFYFPLAVGLLNSKGRDMSLRLKGETDSVPALATKVLTVYEKRQTFIFKGITEKPIPSLLRNFSAPVKLFYDYTPEELAFLMAYDSDPFNRYEAGQRFAVLDLERSIAHIQKGEEPSADPALIFAYGRLLDDRFLDKDFVALALTPPSEKELLENMEICDFNAVARARNHLIRGIARAHEKKLKTIYDSLNDGRPYAHDREAIAGRALKNKALCYLALLGKKEYIELACSQFANADNMTDRVAVLYCLTNIRCKERKTVFERFYADWRLDTLAIDDWLCAQAISELPGVLEWIKTAENDPVYDRKNPNKIHVLLFSFLGNPKYHDPAGEGYEFIAAKIASIDKFNHLIAANLAKRAFENYGRLDPVRKELMRKAIDRLLKSEPSDKLYEIISKI